MAGERVTVEVLYFAGRPHYPAVLAHLHALIAELHVDARVVLKRVESVQAAERERFLGSPTVRIDGHDVDRNAAARTDDGLKCRLYAGVRGVAGDVPDDLIRAALIPTRA